MAHCGIIPMAHGSKEREDRRASMDIQGPVALWTFGATRCLMSRPDAPAPFVVVISDDCSSAARTFGTHDEATQFAVDALRNATTGAPSGFVLALRLTSVKDVVPSGTRARTVARR